MMRRQSILLFFAAILVVAVLVACGGGGKTTTATPATTIVTLSDPPTCGSSSSGPFSSIFVTITDVQIHASSNAGANDPGWVDLTPDLKNSPKQVDLLSAAVSQCFLATLGTTTNLAPGSYQQIRIILADNSTSVPNNACKTAGANCVVLTSDPNNPRPLLLSSEAKTGIKIPSGQIAGGQFTVTAGQSKTLNIDFDACASIVTLGNGQFRLKPVLHAGEVNTTSNAVDGKLVDKTTGVAIVGGKAIVVLEKKDSGGIDRKFMQTTPDASGNFSFCPVPAGTYDIVAVAVNGAGVSYAPAIVTGVGPGSSLGNIPMTAVTGASTGLGSITGQVTTATSGPAGIVEDVTLSALATANSATFTIPLVAQSSATANVSTAAAVSCPVNTDCASYTLSLPGVTPQAVAFTSGTAISFTGGATAPASYTVEAAANCSPDKVTVGPISLSPGVPSVPSPAPTLTMTACL